MIPEQHGWVPPITRGVRIVQVLEQIPADDPVPGRMRADAIEITRAPTSAVIVRWTAGVLEPAILYHAIADADAGSDVRGIHLDELRSRVQQPDGIDTRRPRARIKNDFIVVRVTNRE